MRKRVKKILKIVLIAGLSAVAIIAGSMFLYRVWYNSDGQVEKRHQAALAAQKEAFAQYKREAHKQVLEREYKDFGKYDRWYDPLETYNTENLVPKNGEYTWKSVSKVVIHADPDFYEYYWDGARMKLMMGFVDTLSDSVEDVMKEAGRKQDAKPESEEFPLNYDFASWRKKPSQAECFDGKLKFEKHCTVVVKQRGETYEINRTGDGDYTYYVNDKKQDMDKLEENSTILRLRPYDGPEPDRDYGYTPKSSKSSNGGSSKSSSNGGPDSRKSGENYTDKHPEILEWLANDGDDDNPNGYDMDDYSGGDELYEDYPDDFEDEEDAEDYYYEYGHDG